MTTGEEQAWARLADLTPEEVCSRAMATYDAMSQRYAVKSFGQDIHVSLKDREIVGRSPDGDFLLRRLGYFSRPSILWYLVCAKDIPRTERMVKPADTRGGEIYLKGAHALPLNRLAGKYGRDVEGFLQRGRDLNGEPLRYADASVRLLPLPRVPVAVLLWKGDDEFPSRADLLVDSTSDQQLATDVLWATAMMSVLIML